MTERIKKANKTYCDGHEEEGIEVCNWEDMPGWQMYMKGEITEAELSDMARKELAEMDQTFGKYLRKDEEKPQREESGKGPLDERVKTANRIYKKACVDSGMSPCFFKNFSTWQQFVHGEIGEAEFYEKAREEIRKIGTQHKGDQGQ
ncbi:MAG: hypothetical protein M1398_08655 [Deltaproteobacteria bacterium]|jgi:hypothetical protein|nr:hypothetical protein [Deltaproteobacteria bacterium]MDA8305525.1 hypothetical protein [Deltaproteobacteria bacterium]